MKLSAERGEVHIDYTTGRLGRAGETYDVVFDTVGVTTFADVADLLTHKGTYLPLNGGLRTMLQAVFTRLRGGKRVKHAVSSNTAGGLTELTQLITRGVIKPVVDRVYPMADIAEAHRHVESRHRRGSIIVSISSPTSVSS